MEEIIFSTTYILDERKISVNGYILYKFDIDATI